MKIKIIAQNKKARFDYEVKDTYEAGLCLQGSEVKSLRQGNVSLKDSYVSFRNGEAFLQNSFIAVYQASSYNNHDPERLRKLLLKKEEIEQIERALREKGLTCVPLKIYWKAGRAKVELALVKGKKLHDKRESIKKRDVNREIQQRLRQK